MKETVNSDLVFAGDAPAATLTGRVRAGTLVRLARGIYSRDLAASPERQIRDNWPQVAGRLFPGAVITDRSGRTSGPVRGVLYLAHEGRDRNAELPGLTISARPGIGPIDGDIALPGGLHQASRGRALAENSRPSRSRGGAAPRTLTEPELAEWVDDLCRTDGEERLLQYRTQAEQLAPELAVSASELEATSSLIGAALGTRSVVTKSKSLAARQKGQPYDRTRTQRFDLLVDALRSAAPQSRPVQEGSERRTHLPFYEAYFSNYIEGTEFTIDEAAAAVYDGDVPYGRSADGHDLIGTFEVVNDEAEMSRLATSAPEFLEILRSRNAAVMIGRPEKRPGMFKEAANQAGQTLFVNPELVPGTLSEGIRRLGELDTAWERAVYTAFVVAEVHPFDDGNGRVCRIMMNSELHVGRQSRIIVPTSFRNDYLDGLRLLSRQDDPSVLIKSMRLLLNYTAAIDFTDFHDALAQLHETNAFEDPVRGAQLRVPQRELPPIDYGSELDVSSAEARASGYVIPYRRADGTLVSGYRKPH